MFTTFGSTMLRQRRTRDMTQAVKCDVGTLDSKTAVQLAFRHESVWTLQFTGKSLGGVNSRLLSNLLITTWFPVSTCVFAIG